MNGLASTHAKFTRSDALSGSHRQPVDFGDGLFAWTLDAGRFHTCAALSNETIKCWGANGKGQLGLGYLFGALGDQGDEMGDALSSVDLGMSGHTMGITAGELHNCVWFDREWFRLEGAPKHVVKCWGQNPFGQLGLGDARNRGGDNSMGDNLPTLLLP